MVKLLDLLKREDTASDSRVDLAMGLHGVMVAVAASSLGDPVLQQIIMSLHPMVATSPNYERPNFNRARNELLRCAEILTVHHPRAMIEHVIKCMASSSGTSQHIGAISVMTHLINSKSESVEVAGMKESVLSGKHSFVVVVLLLFCCCCGRTTFGFVAVCVFYLFSLFSPPPPFLVLTLGISLPLSPFSHVNIGTIRLLNSKEIDVRASICQLIVALGNANFLTRDSGRELVLFVVRQCRVSKQEIAAFEKSRSSGWFGGGGASVSPMQLGRASERFVSALGQCATTSVWPLLFSTLTSSDYGGQSIDAVCRTLVDVATGKSVGGEEVGDGGLVRETKTSTFAPSNVDFDGNPDLPSSSLLFARMIVTAIYSTEKLQTSFREGKSRGSSGGGGGGDDEEEEDREDVEIPSSLSLLCTVGSMIHATVGESFHSKLLHVKTKSIGPGAPRTDPNNLPDVHATFRQVGLKMVARDSTWWSSVGNSLSELMITLFRNNSILKSVCFRCLGTVISLVTSSDLPRKWTSEMLRSCDHSDTIQCHGLGESLEQAVLPPVAGAPSRHMDIVLQSIANVLRDECVVIKSGWFGSSDGDRTLADVQRTKATLLLLWGHLSSGASKESLTRHLDAQIVDNMSSILNDIPDASSSEEVRSLRSSFLHGACCLGRALNRGSTETSLQLAPRDDWLKLSCLWMTKFGNSSDMRMSLFRLMTELVRIGPFPSHELRTMVVNVALPTLESDEEGDEDEDMKNIIMPVSDLLSALLETQKDRTRQLRLLRSLTFGGPKTTTLSNCVRSAMELVRRRGLHVVSKLLDVHIRCFPTIAEQTTLSDVYALVAPRVCDRHLRVQCIATSIAHRIVSRSREILLPSDGGTTSSVSSAVTPFFETTSGRSIGAVLKSPSGTQERLAALRNLCNVFSPRISTSQNLRNYVIVLIGSINDTDPAVGVAGAECLLQVFDVRGRNNPELVNLLVPEINKEESGDGGDGGGDGDGGDGGANGASGKSGSSGRSGDKKSSDASAKKPAKSQKEGEDAAREERLERQLKHPRCVAEVLYAMSDRERNENTSSTQGTVLRRHAVALTIFAVRCLASSHFERTIDVLLSTVLPLSSDVLDMFVGLVCPPTSPRPLDDSPLPTSATEPMLQRVIERCIVILNSAPTGTPEEANAVLSSTHQALQSILSAPSSTMNSFVDKYLTQLICGIALSVGSMATALGDIQFVADAMTTADVLLRRAGQSHMCTDLEKIHQVITDVDVPSMLASVVIATTCSMVKAGEKNSKSEFGGEEKEGSGMSAAVSEENTNSRRATVLSTVSNFHGSNDIGQRRTSIATVAALILSLEDLGENPKVMAELLLSKAMDHDHGVVRQAVRGLGNIAIAWTDGTFEKHAPSILNTCVGLMDHKDPVVADSSLSSLVHILKHARRGIIQPLLLNICFRLHSAISGGEIVSSTLVCCFTLLSYLAKFGVDHVDERDMKSQLQEQLHRMLPLVVVQLRSSSFDVSRRLSYSFFSLPPALPPVSADKMWVSFLSSSSFLLVFF
jgi:hypothetical protein